MIDSERRSFCRSHFASNVEPLRRCRRRLPIAHSRAGTSGALNYWGFLPLCFQFVAQPAADRLTRPGSCTPAGRGQSSETARGNPAQRSSICAGRRFLSCRRQRSRVILFEPSPPSVQRPQPFCFSARRAHSAIVLGVHLRVCLKCCSTQRSREIQIDRERERESRRERLWRRRKHFRRAPPTNVVSSAQSKPFPFSSSYFCAPRGFSGAPSRKLLIVTLLRFL